MMESIRTGILQKNFDSIVSAVEATMKVSEMPEIVDILAVTQSPDLSGDLKLEPILKLCTKQDDPLPRFIRGYLKITELIYVFNQLRQKLGEEIAIDAGLNNVALIRNMYVSLATAQALVRSIKPGQERSESLILLSKSMDFSLLPNRMRLLAKVHCPKAVDYLLVAAEPLEMAPPPPILDLDVEPTPPQTN